MRRRLHPPRRTDIRNHTGKTAWRHSRTTDRHRPGSRYAAALSSSLQHEFEPVLPEEHLVADEKGRRAEHAAFDPLIGVGLQLLLDGRIGHERQHAIDVATSFAQHRSDFRQMRVREVARCAARIEEEFNFLHEDRELPHSRQSPPLRPFSLPARTRIAYPQCAWPRQRGRKDPVCGFRP